MFDGHFRGHFVVQKVITLSVKSTLLKNATNLFYNDRHFNTGLKPLKFNVDNAIVRLFLDG